MAAGTLRAQGLWKAFGPVQALQDVSLELRPGEIHAVLGENGAGKSTLMNILAGFLTPDRGSLSLEDVAFPAGHPAQIKALGVEMVHQHFMLVPEFSVAENLALGQLPSLVGTLDLRSATRMPIELAKELGWEIDPAARTGDLPVGLQQRVEILKALSGRGSFLILDEPTAVLSPEEIQDLFRVLRQLKERGQSIALIAHKLSEVMQIADVVTVLRHGRFVASAPMQGLTESHLAKWMIGDLPEPRPQDATPTSGLALSAHKICVGGDRGEAAIQCISFDIRPGEILGFGGVDGNGQVELAESMAQIRKLQSGDFKWRCAPLSDDTSIAYIPQDRQSDGLALDMSVLDNLLIKGIEIPDLWAGPISKPKAMRIWATKLSERFSIKTRSLTLPASSLSGGNQQKVVVSRNLSTWPDLLVAVNPTRGLDFMATNFVHRQIQEASRHGTAVAFFSSDRDELASIAHRTLILSGGRIVGDPQETGARH